MPRDPGDLFQLTQQAKDLESDLVMLYYLDGFIDAGAAGRQLAAHLLTTFEHTEVARFDVDSLIDNLALARGNGFAVDDEEDAEGVICVGAAFFGHDGSCAGAVSVTGIKGDLPAWRMNELGVTVRQYADRVSGILGGASYADRARAIEARP